jgi:intracellular septation protein A
MQRLRAALEFAIWEFGPLIALVAFSAAFGLKVAIAATIGFIVVDAARRVWRHIPFTRIYLLTSSLAIVFGSIDLYSQTPFMLKYEAVITNVATGIAFVAGARGAKPMLQEIAEQRSGPFPDRADIRYFFRLFTLLWAGYFFTKAAVYLWLGAVLPLGRAMLVRSVLGSVSLGFMLVISITQGRRLFLLCRRVGLLPAVEEPQPAQNSQLPGVE